jgi:RNA polymerase sigma-70 factor (ECF subfamily)
MPPERYSEGGPLHEQPLQTVSEALLHERFWDRIRFFAIRQLRDPALAEDVAQETLCRVFEALREGRVRDPVALPSFVFETARNICLHQFRTWRRKAAAHETLAREETTATPPEAALDSMIGAERQALVRRALATLEPRDRELLTRLYVDGEDTATIAAHLEIEPAALRVRKHRALARLRAAVDRLSATFPSFREPVEEQQ